MPEKPKTIAPPVGSMKPVGVKKTNATEKPGAGSIKSKPDKSAGGEDAKAGKALDELDKAAKDKRAKATGKVAEVASDEKDKP